MSVKGEKRLYREWSPGRTTTRGDFRFAQNTMKRGAGTGPSPPVCSCRKPSIRIRVQLSGRHADEQGTTPKDRQNPGFAARYQVLLYSGFDNSENLRRHPPWLCPGSARSSRQGIPAGPGTAFNKPDRRAPSSASRVSSLDMALFLQKRHKTMRDPDPQRGRTRIR